MELELSRCRGNLDSNIVSTRSISRSTALNIQTKERRRNSQLQLTHGSAVLCSRVSVDGESPSLLARYVMLT